MKPAWDKLITEYKDDATALIADVDCTTEGKPLCEEIGVQGFPTIKYGDPNNLEDYEGGRDYAALSAFAKENLGPRCGPANLDLCDEGNKTMVQNFLKMDAAALQKAIAEKEESMAKVEKELEDLLKSLQAQYEAGQKKKDDEKAKIKNSGLGLMKSVAAHQKKAKSEL